MTRLDVRLETGGEVVRVGELLAKDGRTYFQYDPAFRSRGVELSPFKLPTEVAEPLEERARVYGGLHGLFNDSLPDGWGLMLIERTLRSRGLDAARITPLDRLAFIGRRGMGALTYHPPTTADSAEPLEIDLSEIAAQSQRVLAGSTEDLLPELVRAGGSPMGARPKVVVGVSATRDHLITGVDELPNGYQHWLIKFVAQHDPVDVGAIESAYAAMARAAGIDVPPTHLFAARDGRRYFGVERFDRDPHDATRRHHIHTLAGLLHHDHRIPGQDYLDLLKVARLLTRDHRDVVEALRRSVFNVLAHNRDDHTKNFAFRMSAEGHWRLAPAYDLTFSEGPDGEHTMLVHGAGQRPTLAHIDQLAAAASIEKRELRDVVEQVRSAVAAWPTFADAAGVDPTSRRFIKRRHDDTAAEFLRP